MIDVGAADVHRVIGAEYEGSLDGVLEAYNGALRRVFLVCVVACCLTLLGALGVEWVSVKKGKKVDKKDEQGQRAGSVAEGDGKVQAK